MENILILLLIKNAKRIPHSMNNIESNRYTFTYQHRKDLPFQVWLYCISSWNINPKDKIN